jgi:hypothetical protein
MSGPEQYASTEHLVPGAQRSRRFGERARVSWVVWGRVGHQRTRFHAVDVSPRGAKLRPRSLFPVGTPIHLDFIKPNGRHLHVSGVVWRIDSDGMAVLFLGTIPTGFDLAPER